MSESRSTHVPAIIEPTEHNRVTQAILDFVSQVPDSRIPDSADPATEARSPPARWRCRPVRWDG
jgi:hypothetical protein